MPQTSASVFPHNGGALGRRVLLLTPGEGDAAAICRVLSLVGIEAATCLDLVTIATELGRDTFRGAGAVVIAQEGLFVAGRGEHRALAAALKAQPEWSDLPLILLAGGPGQGERAWEFAQGLEPVGNITILERPLRRATLLNAIMVALRARDRQYDLRETLHELGQHRQHLEKLVGEKAAELAASTASLHAAERLASLGTMAAGLGHDMANLTLPIRARLESLRGAVASDDGVADLDAIGEALAHLSRLSAGMRLMALDPSRESASTPADDLSAWADETVPMLRASLPRHVHLECAIAPGLGVSIPRHRLAQAVFNLVQNAGEAMATRENGTVRIVAQPAAPDGPAPAVFMAIHDNGPGMTAEVRARCFEPYFSTKARAISTGMGLGMVRGIIEAAGGTITVESVPGSGTTFCLTLPRTGDAMVAEPAGPRITCAISVSQPRVARLVRLFLNELRIASVHHDAASPPHSNLWVLEDGAMDPLDEYLDRGRDRRAVVLVRHGPDHQQRANEARVRHGDRLVAIPDTPSAGVLSGAIAAMAGRAGVAAPA